MTNITEIRERRKQIQKQYSEEIGKDWMVIFNGNEGYATWDYQRWLEDKLAAQNQIRLENADNTPQNTP